MTYKTRRQLPLDVMVLLPLLVLVVFSYVPMAGIVIAFQKFIPAKGLFGDQKWIGLDNFIYIANLPHARARLPQLPHHSVPEDRLRPDRPDHRRPSC